MTVCCGCALLTVQGCRQVANVPTHPSEVCTIYTTMQSWHKNVIVWGRNVGWVCNEATCWGFLSALEETAVVHLHSNCTSEVCMHCAQATFVAACVGLQALLTYYMCCCMHWRYIQDLPVSIVCRTRLRNTTTTISRVFSVLLSTNPLTGHAHALAARSHIQAHRVAPFASGYGIPCNAASNAALLLCSVRSLQPLD